MLLENRVAIVTGGAKGMGRGIALMFAREGCDVVVNALHIEGAEKVAEEIRDLGRRSLAIKADISSSTEVNDMVDRTIKEFGKIDILVNNAGVVRPYPLKFSGWPYNTGDGIRMAQKAGADLWHMNTMCGYLNIWVPEYKAAWLLVFGRGIWVNKYGKRYTDEGVRIKSHNWWLKHMDYNLDEPGYAAVPTYLIFDETVRKQGPIAANSASGTEYLLGIQAYPAELGGCPEGWSHDNMREIEKGWIKQADTVKELGRLIGGAMDPATLEETVNRYNGYCEQGYDPEFNRGAEALKPLVTPPFYSCALYPGGINTCGGPRRNAHGQVLDPYKKTIPRLYSAGEMGSICGNLYGIGGLNAGEMLASGRLAGKHVAALKNWD